jgi:hypothetical protein
VPLPDPWGLKWWCFWDDTTGSNTPTSELVTEIDWDNTAGVARVARIVMKDGSVLNVPVAAGASGSHGLNPPQQRSWASIQFLLG